MYLTDVVTLAVGTLIVLVVTHLAVFFVTKTVNNKPTVVYMQAPPQQAPAPQPQVTFAQPPETHQTTYVPTVDAPLQMSTAVPDLPKRHGE
jgi:hypothetical protein